MITRAAARSVLQGSPSFRIVGAHCKSSRLNAVGNRWRCAGFHLARRTSLLRARLEDELEVRLGRLVDAGLDHVRARGRPVLSDATDSIIKQCSAVPCGLSLSVPCRIPFQWLLHRGLSHSEGTQCGESNTASPGPAGCGRCWQSRHSPRRRSHEPMRILQRATCKTRRTRRNALGTACNMQDATTKPKVRSATVT
jgi:hypothetical protein